MNTVKHSVLNVALYHMLCVFISYYVLNTKHAIEEGRWWAGRYTQIHSP